MKNTKVLFSAMALSLTMVTANKVGAIGVFVPGDIVLILNGTYHTQGITTNGAGGAIRI